METPGLAEIEKDEINRMISTMPSCHMRNVFASTDTINPTNISAHVMVARECETEEELELLTHITAMVNISAARSMKMRTCLHHYRPKALMRSSSLPLSWSYRCDLAYHHHRDLTAQTSCGGSGSCIRV